MIRPRWFLLFLFSILVPLAAPQLASAATHTTDHYPWVRNVAWSNIRVGAIKHGPSYGLTQVSVDFWMQQPHLNGGGPYSPCLNTSDPYTNGSCALPGGYFKVHSSDAWGNVSYPYGIFIENHNGGNHYWGNRAAAGALEIYPKFSDPTCPAHNPSPCWSGHPPTWGSEVTGGARVTVHGFPTYANGGAYSADVGVVSLPKYNEPGVVRLNGIAWKHGSPLLGHGRMGIDVFGWSPDYGRSSTGYPVYAFSSGHTKDDGYYNTGPLIGGSSKVFRIYFTDADNGRKVDCLFYIPHQYARIDPNLSDNNYFGLNGTGWSCSKNF